MTRFNPDHCVRLTYFLKDQLSPERHCLIKQHAVIPDGHYGFLEFYCTKPHCDCREMMIKIVELSDLHHIFAIVRFAWEKEADYCSWFEMESGLSYCPGAFLDMTSPAGAIPDALLGIFKEMIENEGYLKQIQAHYWMVSLESRVDLMGTHGA